MRKIIIFLTFSLLSLTVAHADFFDDNVTNGDLETTAIDRIELGTYSLISAREKTRYANALKWIEGVKGEAKYRYRDGRITYYRMQDIIHDLDSLVYLMNQHFAYYTRYERTKNTTYLTESESYYDDARTAYDRLRGSLARSNRDYQKVETEYDPEGRYYYPVLERTTY